ncbi:MAG: DUF2993 domain-containing protein [Firmicutes bacterium]|nr:DUF2993 domain-containing protein [Bacillota bacterium]
MSKVILVLVLVVLLLAAGQVLVPRVAGQALSQSLAQVTGPGSRDAVAVGAVPFFQLFQGRFQAVDVSADHVDAGGLTIGSLLVRWQNGAVNVPALVQHHELRVLKEGVLSATVHVNGPALARFLEASGRIQHAQVTVTPSYVRIRGIVNVGGINGPLDATGRFSIGSRGRTILFQPLSVDGFGVPVVTRLVILDVKSLHLPIPVTVTGVRLAPPYVVVTAHSS